MIRGMAGDRRDFIAGSAGILVGAGLPGTYARLAGAADPIGSAPRSPVRTITAGVAADARDPAAAISRAGGLLDRARLAFGEAGFEVQTTRIVTQPYADYAGDLSVSSFRDLLQSMQAAADPHFLCVGPGRVAAANAENAIAKSLAAALMGVSSTLSLGDPSTGVHSPALDAATAVVELITREDPAANFNFAAVANVPPGIPFFPAGFHDGGPDSFAVGVESAGLFLSIAQDASDLAAAGDAIAAAYATELQLIAAISQQVAKETGISFRGIDPTPAQWGEKSIGAAVEHLTGAPFGTPGTLSVCELFTSIVRSVAVTQTGYRGLFLPPMEDATLAARAQDFFGLDSLLAYSSVCGTGLDTVALPGDIKTAEIRRILRDVASLAITLDKPLTARLFPVPGRNAGESTGPVGDLFPMKVLRVR
ncbi:MAG: DUF711 family protein [Gammaproteobacteria bacterium]|nr:DUF711 family protein [Gammaproteobacteria bacterium]